MSDYTIDDFTTKLQVTNADLLAFAVSHINLPPDLVRKYRDQMNSVRERLTKYIDEHPDYNMVKTLHSGSLAKGTAIRIGGDLDLAIYVKSAAMNNIDNRGLIEWLRDRLRELYPGFDEDQLEMHRHCVTIHYKTPGLKDIDVVPVLYKDEPDNRGELVTRDGTRVATSISLHIEFIQNRKRRHPDHFAQFIRFIKYWIKLQKMEYEQRGGYFRFKSLMAELICAHLCDNGLDPSDYIEALRQFFAYIVKTGLKEPIFFTDYYNSSSINLSDTEIIQIFDPVNPENNIAKTYSESDRQQIVLEAQKALNAIIVASSATTSQEAVANWQVVLGPTFQG